jgi:hypothetical protein
MMPTIPTHQPITSVKKKLATSTSTSTIDPTELSKKELKKKKADKERKEKEDAVRRLRGFLTTIPVLVSDTIIQNQLPSSQIQAQQTFAEELSKSKLKKKTKIPIIKNYNKQNKNKNNKKNIIVKDTDTLHDIDNILCTYSPRILSKINLDNNTHILHAHSHDITTITQHFSSSQLPILDDSAANTINSTITDNPE